MTYDELVILFANSAAIRLLRARNAALLLGFLHRAFKDGGRLTITNNDLVAQLADYLETLNLPDEETGVPAEPNEFAFYTTRARYLIDTWCNEENRYLRKYPDENGESVHELTTEAEKVFQWITSLQKKEFVGTESRFIDIFTKLKELIENSMDDPVKRIDELERKKREIASEINRIKITGKADTFSNTQIKERFYEIGKLGRELSSDFKEVEQNFKDIIRGIYEKQMQQDTTRGNILGYALDAAEELKESDQGKSFYAFWLFLIAADKQDELNTLIEKVQGILDERNIPISDFYLQNLKMFLHNAGQKVVASNHRLADKLSRVLTERYFLDRQKTIRLIQDIKKTAMECTDNPPLQTGFLMIEGTPSIRLGMDRPLGEPPQTAAFVRQPDDIGNESLTPENMKHIFETFEIDKEVLKARVAELLEEEGQVRLDKVIERYPIHKGLAEIVSYFSIAGDSPRHIIDDREYSRIVYSQDDMPKSVRVPVVIYVR